MTSDGHDARMRAFLSPKAPEIFHGVAYRHDIWTPDPFDVETIHAEARDSFERLLHRASASDPASGRILLVLGEAGSGKTHLLRAFRATTHGQGLGYFAYMQMTSSITNYARYILAHTVTSFDQPYDATFGDRTGWMRLSSRIAEDPALVPPAHLELLRAERGARALARLVGSLSAHVVERIGDRHLDIDLVRALLYLQHEHPVVRRATLRWLRCENLATNDREAVGALVPRVHDDDPQQQLESLGSLIHTLEKRALVICVDQLEDIYSDDSESRELARRSLQTICRLHERVPSSVFVVACLEDLWAALSPLFTRSTLDRVERDPEPARLAGARSEEEIRLVVARRLAWLFDGFGVAVDSESPLDPFEETEIQKLAGLRFRDVLHRCQRARERSIAAGEPPRIFDSAPSVRATLTEAATGAAATEPPSQLGTSHESNVDAETERRWSDFQVTGEETVPGDEARRAKLLAWALEAAGLELPGRFVVAAHPREAFVDLEIRGDAGRPLHYLVGLCDKSARGGVLERQIDELARAAGERTPVAARSTEFPSNPSTKIARRLGQFIADGGRRVVIEDSDWRAMALLRRFLETGGDPDRLASWRRVAHPLTRLHSVQELIGLEEIEELIREAGWRDAGASGGELGSNASRGAVDGTSRAQGTGSNSNASTSSPLERAASGVELGTRAGLAAGPFLVDVDALDRHAAFLGSSGSGKTTLALALIESLIERGIPAILVDRKGDLASWADPEAWNRPLGDPILEERRTRLQRRCEVALYTPGQPAGRALSMAAIPSGLGSIPSFERSEIAKQAAANLGGLMNYNPTNRNQGLRVTTLAKAIEVRAALRPESDPTLEDVIGILDPPDPSLVQALGRISPKRIPELIEDLQNFIFLHERLLGDPSQRLDVASLLGHANGEPNLSRTRLSIVSTKFLGDNNAVVFWVAQLLFELGRFASRNPSDHLQAVILFDEADLYLPALGKPATKPLMENALKRFRSAGIGVFLATQSPGDLDYKCRDNIRTWFVGQVKEKTALDKMRPMLADCQTDIRAQIATQGVGEFSVIQDGKVVAIRGRRSLVSAEQLPEERILELARGTAPVEEGARGGAK